MVSRFDVHMINLDPELSRDPKNTRPGVVLSPDELNRNMATVIIAPISSTKLMYPTRVAVEFLGNSRAVILDQIRTIEKVRLVKKIGEIDDASKKTITEKLHELFAE